MPIFRPLASQMRGENEVTYEHRTSHRFAATHNEISTSSAASLGKDKKTRVRMVKAVV